MAAAIGPVGSVRAADTASRAVPDQYIIVFRDPVADPAAAAADMAHAHSLGLGFVYGHALKGFSATIPAARLAAIQAYPRVA